MADIPDLQIQKIYPTEADISLIDYDGINSSENNFTNNLRNRSPRNYVLPNIDGNGADLLTAGFNVTKDTETTIDIDAGRAYLVGRVVEIVDTYNQLAQTVTNDNDNYIYVKLNITAGAVDSVASVTIVINPVAIGTKAPFVPNSTMIAMVRVVGGVMIEIVDRRQSPESIPILNPSWNFKWSTTGEVNGNSDVPLVGATGTEYFLIQQDQTFKENYGLLDNTPFDNRVVNYKAVTTSSADKRIWKAIPTPDWDSGLFSVGGLVAIGLEEGRSNATGTINYTLKIYLKNEDGTVSAASSVSGVVEWWTTEDDNSVINMEYLSIDVTDDTYNNNVTGQQLQMAISVEITGTGGDGLSDGILTVQTEPDYNNPDMMVDLAVIDDPGGRLQLSGVLTPRTSHTWKVKSTNTKY